MPSRFWLKILIGWCISFDCLGQENHDFDADSVLYMPIPKPSAQSTIKTKGAGETSESQRFQYFLTVKSGSLSGEGVSFSTSVVQGLMFTPRFRSGLGIGYDAYLDASVSPIFISSTLDLSRKKNSIFVAFNGGISKVWDHFVYYAGEPLVDFQGGLMINPELGYRIRYHDLRLGLSIGWKSQRVKYYYEYYYNGYWDPSRGWVQGEPNRTTVKEDKRRLSISLNIGWK
jgi:hypothetical protein